MVGPFQGEVGFVPKRREVSVQMRVFRSGGANGLVSASKGKVSGTPLCRECFSRSVFPCPRISAVRASLRNDTTWIEH